MEQEKINELNREEQMKSSSFNQFLSDYKNEIYEGFIEDHYEEFMMYANEWFEDWLDDQQRFNEVK